MTKRKPAMSVAEAAATGDEYVALAAIRDKLATVMDSAPPYVVPRIASQLLAVLKRMSTLSPSGTEVTLEDELERRRTARHRTS